MKDMIRKLLPKRFRKEVTIVPVVRLSGAIMAGGNALRPALNLASVSQTLEKAFSVKKAPAVAILVNSPGGSPVQARQVFARIRQLAAEKHKKVFIFVEDIAASGGYMIALAGDEIIADPTSIVGSIGVISGGFGFTELLKKIGVERRVHTAGENKAVLDPFQPEKASDVEHLKALQAEIHTVFIDMVKERRGSRLADDPDLFSGLFWTGAKGLELGLVDGLGDLRGTLMARYGKDVKVLPVSAGRGLFGRRLPGLAAAGPERIAAAAVDGLAQAAEERALWARFGL